jgi:hypothetical protein
VGRRHAVARQFDGEDRQAHPDRDLVQTDPALDVRAHAVVGREQQQRARCQRVAGAAHHDGHARREDVEQEFGARGHEVTHAFDAAGHHRQVEAGGHPARPAVQHDRRCAVVGRGRDRRAQRGHQIGRQRVGLAVVDADDEDLAVAGRRQRGVFGTHGR